MHLNDLLGRQNISPEDVIVLRHRPHEPRLRKLLPWIASERHDLYNAFQRSHGPRLEAAMEKVIGSGLLASFVGHEPGKAVFVGLYRIAAAKPLTHQQFWRVPEHTELREFGMAGWSGDDDRRTILQFDLEPTDFCEAWRGKLVIHWPPPERAWWRRAYKNDMPVLAIHEESVLAPSMPGWNELDLSWQELEILPASWRMALSQWRGIYYIYDETDGKAYVGSAYGRDNILGRWLAYAATGHGGNSRLRKRDPARFRFTILQRVSPDLEATEVMQLEATWKRRLHTHHPDGLNDN